MIALTDSQLKKLVSEDQLVSHSSSLDDLVQPASIDIPVGSRAFHMSTNIVPHQKLISDLVKEYAIQELDLTKGAKLLNGETYFIPVGEINLAKNIAARISPKSSVGRIDLHVRSMLDRSGVYDVASAGYRGQWWLSVIPNSFGGVILDSNHSLAQLMAFDISKKARSTSEIVLDDIPLFDGLGLPVPKKTLDNEILMHVAIPKNAPVAYMAKKTDLFVDMRSYDNEWNAFWEPVYANSDGSFTFEKDKFYIMATKEKITIPETYSVEMKPNSHNVGELRIHYAGFFDPGFGINYVSGKAEGATAVLEVRPHERLTVFDNSPICTMKVYRNSKLPRSPYGKDGTSNYANQSNIKLSKYFTTPADMKN